MKLSTYEPDALQPGARSLSYGVFCWLNRHITVLRALGALLRRWPSVGGLFGMVARASAVKDVLTRTRSFSNTAHAANMVSGDYLIGMDPGPTYSADRDLVHARLAALDVPADSDAEAQRRIKDLSKPGAAEFDLIDDYLMWAVFHAMRPLFGDAIGAVVAGSATNAAQGDVDEGLQRQYMLEIRYVAGQLLAGNLATLDLRRRAESCGDALHARIDRVTGPIGAAWGVKSSSEDIERNAVGLAWISHPVTVQSGALVMQELLGRQKVYEQLRSRARALGESRVWTDADFRKAVRNHVLELMRFRPIFPLLARDVPRDTEMETGARSNAGCPGGGKVSLLSIAALFDPSAVPQSGRFCPNRDWGSEDALRYLMFGYGYRQCPARDYAVDILTSALIGLLTLPRLQLARGEGKAIAYDGPLMLCMRMRIT
ncbi:cytochrome P450 [Bradyrhizobium diazoefficiens]